MEIRRESATSAADFQRDLKLQETNDQTSIADDAKKRTGSYGLQQYDTDKMLQSENNKAMAAALGMKFDDHFAEKIQSLLENQECLYDHKHLLQDIHNQLLELRKQTDKDDDEIKIPKELEEKIRHYVKVFIPESEKLLNMDERLDPLAPFYNKNHGAFMSPADLAAGKEPNGPIINIQKKDIDKIAHGLGDVVNNRILNRLQSLSAESQTHQKNYEVIMYLLMMILARPDESDTMIRNQTAR